MPRLHCSALRVLELGQAPVRERTIDDARNERGEILGLPVGRRG